MNMKENRQSIKYLRDGEPCSPRGCLNHISHPCEGCGRIGGMGVFLMSNPNKPNDWLLDAFREKDTGAKYLIIPITEEDKKRDREWIMKYIEDRKLMRKDYTEALNEYGGDNPYDR